MPIYVYECECGDVADEFHSVESRNNPTPCKVCNSTNRTIQIQPCLTTAKGNRLITAREADHKYGKNWSDRAGVRPKPIYSFKTRG